MAVWLTQRPKPSKSTTNLSRCCKRKGRGRKGDRTYYGFAINYWVGIQRSPHHSHGTRTSAFRQKTYSQYNHHPLWRWYTPALAWRIL